MVNHMKSINVLLAQSPSEKDTIRAYFSSTIFIKYPLVCKAVGGCLYLGIIYKMKDWQNRQKVCGSGETVVFPSEAGWSRVTVLIYNQAQVRSYESEKSKCWISGTTSTQFQSGLFRCKVIRTHRQTDTDRHTYIYIRLCMCVRVCTCISICWCSFLRVYISVKKYEKRYV